MKLSAFAAVSLLALSAAGCGAAPSNYPATRAQALKGLRPAALAAVPSALDDYVARPEPAYKWAITDAPSSTTGARSWDLEVTSQTWHGITWTHHVQVFVPAKIEFPGKALLSLSFGSGSLTETLFGQLAANSTGAVFVNVFDVPNQPLFNAQEDGLIALTFDKYLESGDATWPLLLPMTKSATQAMRAIEEFSRQKLATPLTQFAVAGASKRGWTTYLTAAVEAKAHPGRVIGIAPSVYDNLNLAAQLKHQKATWGEFSPRIVDYTRRDLPRKMVSAEGAKLVEIVDPFTYRDRLTMPKLLVCASNDEYWNLDAFDYYGAQLPGETARYEAPNTGHFLSGQEQRALGAMGQWFRMVAAGRPLPKLTLTRKDSEVSLSAQDSGKISALRLWVSHAATRDFRLSKWTAPKGAKTIISGDMQLTTHFQLPPAPADAPFTAIFGEIEVPGSPLPLVLSTPVQIWGPDTTARSAAR